MSSGQVLQFAYENIKKIHEMQVLFVVPSSLEFRLVFFQGVRCLKNIKEENKLDHNFMSSLMLYSLGLFEIDLIMLVL